MLSMSETTREKLLKASAVLFRQKGFHGVGVSEILAASGVPRGSLYHHFPDGKQDLALAAASWAKDGMLEIIDSAFGDASSYRQGATTLCHKIAKYFDISGQWDGCPVSSILNDGPGNETFRASISDALESWITRIATHGERLGEPAKIARPQAEMLMIGIQGTWALARARASSDELRQLPVRLYGSCESATD